MLTGKNGVCTSSKTLKMLTRLVWASIANDSATMKYSRCGMSVVQIGVFLERVRWSKPSTFIHERHDRSRLASRGSDFNLERLAHSARRRLAMLRALLGHENALLHLYDLKCRQPGHELRGEGRGRTLKCYGKRCNRNVVA